MPDYNIGGRNWGSHIAYKKESEIRKPSEQIVFVDSIYGNTGNSGCAFVEQDCMAYINFRHTNLTNCAFADGHVEARNRSQLYQGPSNWINTTPWGWP